MSKLTRAALALLLALCAASPVAAQDIAPNIPGPQGQQGSAGSNGTNGSNGAAATVTAGTATGLSVGSPPTVNNSGTSSAAVFNFGVPIGATGATGSTGPAGILCYNSAGQITGCKQWFGTATINASGAWALTFGAGVSFSSILWTQFSSTSASNSGLVAISSGSCTTSGCSGTATGALNVLGLLTLSLSNINGSQVSVQVVGS